jgi:hypothetical protein
MRIDPDVYLSNDTMRWCEQALQQLNHPQDPAASEFLPATRRYLVPAWYRQLRRLARNHIESGELPVLAIAPKPDNRNVWQARQQVINEVRNEVDTFGLVETDLNSAGEHSDEDWDY